MILISELKKEAAREKKQLINFLRDIIRIKSPSGKEKEVSRRVYREMTSAGFDKVITSGYGSVIGRIGKGRKKILYDAHIDTVAAGNIKNWKYNPYKAVYRNGIIYGRGACDDKGSVAAMVASVNLIRRLKLTEDYTLWVSASAFEEEAQGKGIAEVIKITGRPDYIVIGEPSGLKIIRGHKGRMGIKISTQGKSVHASIPEKGINAIYAMAPLIEKAGRLNRSFRNNSVLGKSTVSVTKVESGSASHNTIPDNCTMWLDRRTTEKETERKVMREMNILAGSRGRVEVLNRYFPAWIIDNRHPIVESAAETYEVIFGKKPEVKLWPFCTNGSYTMGEENIPTIGFGPGEEKMCHVTDECIRIEEVLKAMMFYALFPTILSGRAYK
jgi:putative selenium metabolism hydrolase